MKPPKRPASPPTPYQGELGLFPKINSLASVLIRTLGPHLGAIAFIVVLGIIAVQFARSDVAAVSIAVMVVAALVALMIGRIKNVL